jgi:glycerol-3-phosphate acyltransferase PlsX
MGGDNAPDATIKGAVKAAKEIDSEIILIGNEEIINTKVKDFFGKDSIKEVASNISIKHTTESIEMCDIPTQAIKTKKDSSMVVGFKMLKEGEGDVFISAGNSGALRGLTDQLLHQYFQHIKRVSYLWMLELTHIVNL